MALEFNPTAGTHSHTSGVGAQTVFTFTPTANTVCKGVWLDMTNMTQTTTIALAYQIDGTNYRTFQSVLWNTSMDDGVLINGDIPLAVSKGLRLQLTSSVAEGASRNVSWERFAEGLGSGAITFTYTVTNSVNGTPIQGAEVWVTTDASGANVVASGLTNASGQIVFYLDAGTYQFWRQHASFSFQNPDAEVVS